MMRHRQNFNSFRFRKIRRMAHEILIRFWIYRSCFLMIFQGWKTIAKRRRINAEASLRKNSEPLKTLFFLTGKNDIFKVSRCSAVRDTLRSLLKKSYQNPVKNPPNFALKIKRTLSLKIIENCIRNLKISFRNVYKMLFETVFDFW